MSQYFVYYTESNLVCFVIFVIMLVHDLVSVDRQEKQIKFDRALGAFMGYFITDSVWASIISGVIPGWLPLVLLVNFLNFILMAYLTYSWLNYVLAFEQYPKRNRPFNRFGVLFPFIVSLLALVIT